MVPPNLTNELAKQRNRNAADRTLMAWVRTCLSLISFGFGLDKIIAAIDRGTKGAGSHAELGVRLVSMAFVILGIAAMAAATVQHRQELRRLRDDFVYVVEQRSIARATAVAITGIGAFALLLLILGLVAR
jgi:putative membrane protein